MQINFHTGQNSTKMHFAAPDAEPIQKREENFLITFQALLFLFMVHR